MSLVKNYIFKQISQNNLSQDEAESMLRELQKSQSERASESIAIIGMAGRFPTCDNLKEFWDRLENGVNCIGEFPEHRRKDSDHILSKLCYIEFLTGEILPEYEDPADLYTKGGFLNQIDKFDAPFFGIPPREAKFMDPLQRIFLETAYEAIDDAGYGGEKITGSRTGVFVGRDTTNIPTYRYITEPDSMHLTGSWEGIMASRLSYIFNLQGPAMVVDTACSSGLVSVHMACQSIKNGECDMAIAGGINVTLWGMMKDIKGPLDLSSVEAADDKVRTFDKDASGTIWSEGVGAVLLKPLSKALEDKDHIYAVIRGSAINNDGASNGITAPSASAQEEVIVRAWKEARLNPETISYVEAHGTGTVLGDPIEIKGLTNAFRRYTDKKQFCGIGSLKTNMGHMVAASGIASLLKVVLSLKNKKVPPTINFENPNPYVNFSESPLYVNDKLSHWERGEVPRRAGVSSFGFSGTNCHVVLEEAPEITEEPAVREAGPHVLALSAKSENVLHDLVARYKEYVEEAKESDIAHICYTANTGKGHYFHRIAIVFHNLDELKNKLKRISTADMKNSWIDGVFYGEHKIVSERKTAREYGEITASEKSKFTRELESKLDELPGSAPEDYAALLREICYLYAKGADLDWDKFYQGKKLRKVNVPVYPLEKIRFWAGPKESKMTCRVTGHEESHQHPLVHRLLADSINQQIYESEFSIDQQWVLTDHKILDNCVIPGTTYIEMAREVGKRFYHSDQLELKDVLFFTPMVVREDEKKKVQTVVTKEDGYIEFLVASKQETGMEGETVWVKHAEGKIFKIEQTVKEPWKIEELTSKYKKVSENIDLHSVKGVFGFGPRWQNLRDMYAGENEVFVRLELPEEFWDDLQDYLYHPAMLDNAVNVISQSSGDGTYLPFTYKSFRIYDKMPAELYTYVKRKTGHAANKETITFDVAMMDADGKWIAEISDYTIKKVHQTELKFKELSGKNSSYYELAWVPKEIPADQAALSEGTALLFKDRTGLADRLLEQLKQHQKACIEVEVGNCFERIGHNHYMVGSSLEDYEALMEEIREKGVTEIFHLASIDSANEIGSLEQLESAQGKGLRSLFHMVKALISKKVKGQISIHIVSAFANEVMEGQLAVHPHHAALMGLGKVVEQEYTNLSCKFIDIDHMTDAQTILRESMVTGPSYAVAYRDNVRYVEELRKVDIGNDSAQSIEWKEGNTYVITGGTGGLGLEIGKYLASKGKANLVLLNRSKLPEREEWDRILEKGSDQKAIDRIKAILEMERQGANITCCSADVSQYDEVKAALESVRSRFGRISGVVHCAGLAGDGFIMHKEESTFRSVIEPKVKGTWILDQLTREDQPDFFVMFSSITSLFGGVGQGDYTAANSYLDSFAAYRNRLGLKTIAINWPAWKETGMAVDYQATGDVALFKSIATSRAIDSFEQILNSSRGKVVPGELNYSFLASESRLPFVLSDQIRIMVDKQKARTVKTEGASKKAGKKHVQVLVKGKGGEEYTETEHVLAQIWAQVLDIAEIDVFENFHAMGGDSILATHLLKAVDGVYPGIVDISDIFSYPSVIQMAEYIDKKQAEKEKKASLAGKRSKDLSEDQLTDILNSLESGEISIESALESLSK